MIIINGTFDLSDPRVIVNGSVGWLVAYSMNQDSGFSNLVMFFELPNPDVILTENHFIHSAIKSK